MAVFGKIDAATFANTVAVTNGDATVTKDAADTVAEGDVLVLGGVSYIVRTVTSTTSIELHTTYAGSTDGALAGAVRRTPPKELAQYVVRGGDSFVGEILFVDATEAELSENKERGLSGPGWWHYKTYTDAAGDTRHKAEHIAELYVAAGTSGDDADDTKVADVASAITISAQPANVTGAADPYTNATAFAVTASATTGSLLYQWQRQTASGTRWTNVTNAGVFSGATTDTLAITGAAKADYDGYKFRVKLTSTAGAEEVISATGTLTFA